MSSVNENGKAILLRRLMDEDQGWGRELGRAVYRRLLTYVESNPGVAIFRVSLEGVRRVDISFGSETIVEIAKRYRGSKGFCFVDLRDQDMAENWDAAATKKTQPLMSWEGETERVLGPAPSQGNRDALRFAVARSVSRAAEFAQATPGMSVANASMKFKQLWEQGFLLRREASAESGGVEFLYFPIK